MYRCPCDRDFVSFHLDYPVAVALWTFDQTCHDDPATNQTCPAPWTIGNVQVFGQVFLHVSEHKSASLSLVWSDGGCGIYSLLYRNKAASQKFYALSQWEKHLLSSHFRPGCSLADSITCSCIRIASEKPQNCIIFASILHREKYHAKSFSSVS